ncbi:N-acyl amino acid synthase FeeM domain-containing protein [Massilia pseudoviolaceinigra]|uniref:N-acyl amino acid synthase FeeM domain-containing protein n=1 Tax=Massilia pseudoviolaceinigra TaxID=3057165 RepID=UPI002796BED4|nr:long-chain N-acyl amino acid synthase [Massilia sp. CCM 9206]MDQ1921491.1 long-chain N-acyl amino acid synthase [Massilia sp. CCM 9206]
MFQDELPIATFEMPAGLREPDGGVATATEPDPGQAMQAFHIRLANSAGRREAASLLIRKMYGWRGYAFEPSLHHDPHKVTLYAETGGVLVGTMSLCLDSEFRLPADDNFRDKLDLLRSQGRRLCEPSRLAIDKGVTKRVFASLIHISYLYSHKLHGFTDYVIEVNPRHVMFYKRMLGFSDFGSERPCHRVGAPAVLLRLPLAEMGEQIRKWGGLMEQHGEERSFYPYFFPQHDEPGITARLNGGYHATGGRDAYY